MMLKKSIFLAVVLMMLPLETLCPAFFESDVQTGLILTAREKMIRKDAPIGNPVTFYVEDADMLAIAVFSSDTDILDEIKMWQIQIFNSNNEKVSYVQGKNGLSSRVIPWSGFSSAGEQLPDGFYTARFVWTDARGKFHKTERITISLDTPLGIRNLSGFNLRFDYTDEGLVIRIPEVSIFKVGEYKIRESVLSALNEINVFLKAYPKNKVVIRGHTDSSGALSMNIRLSHKRAYSVYRYFIDNGIKPDRMTYQGLGPNQPIASNLTKAGRAKNRRVDVVVLKTTG